jgi:hypothetical protein
MSFEKWAEEVNNLFLEKVCCSWADLSGEDLREMYASGQTPTEFVDWWIEKYDLIVL